MRTWHIILSLPKLVSTDVNVWAGEIATSAEAELALCRADALLQVRSARAGHYYFNHTTAVLAEQPMAWTSNIEIASKQIPRGVSRIMTPDLNRGNSTMAPANSHLEGDAPHSASNVSKPPRLLSSGLSSLPTSPVSKAERGDLENAFMPSSSLWRKGARFSCFTAATLLAGAVLVIGVCCVERKSVQNHDTLSAYNWG